MFRRKYCEVYTFFSNNTKRACKRQESDIQKTFIHRVRFAASSLSILADNLPEGLHKGECMDCKSCHEYMNVKDRLSLFRCVDCNKNYEKGFDKDLTKRFYSTYKFCDEAWGNFV